MCTCLPSAADRAINGGGACSHEEPVAVITAFGKGARI